MAKYRHYVLLPAKSAATAGTETIDLDVVDPISKLMIIFKATSAGTQQAANPAGNVTKIELVDGSDVIAAVSGKECQALDFYNSKFMPDNFVADSSGIMMFSTFSLNFGRKLWDTDLALDPTKFKNPQLKITHNYQIADTSASAASLQVDAFLFDEKKISPIGYLRPTEVYSYTNSTENSVETIDIPRDLSIRQMLINTYGDGYYPWQIANKVKIEENGGSKVPFDFSTTAWLKFINQNYPTAKEKCYLDLLTTARHLYCAPSFTVAPHLISKIAGSVITINDCNSPVPLHVIASVAGTAYGDCEGWNPHGSFPIPFGNQDDFTDWYDVSPLGSLKMKITSGSASTSGSTKIVLEQLKRYTA